MIQKITAIIKGFFAKDLLWKIFSLLAAFVLWFIVMNTLNPTETKSFIVKPSFINETALTSGETPLIIMNRDEVEDTSITVKVENSRPALDDLSKNKDSITAHIDLEQLNAVTLPQSDEPQTVSLSVSPILPRSESGYSYNNASCSPNTISITVDRAEERTMKLNIDVTGELEAGYNAADPVCDVDAVTISGPQSEMSKVSQVKATIDIAGKTDDVDISVAPAVYDADGKVLELFSVEPSVIDVSVAIDRQWQIPVTEPEITGELNENLVLDSIDYSPKSINIDGSIDDINKVKSIQLPAVDLSTIDHSQTISFDIRPSLKGTELKLASDAPTSVEVDVKVSSKASKDITLDKSAFTVTGAADNLSVTIENVNITIYGAQSVIDTVTASSLKPVIDLSGMSEGWHSVPFTVTLPENAECRDTLTATVILKDKTVQTQAEATTETATEATTAEEQETQSTEELSTQAATEE